MNYTAFISGTNVNATSGGGDPIGNCGAMSHDVWYTFVAPQSSPYVVTTCLPGTDFDTVIAVWSGSACGSLVQIGCNDDGCYPGGPWPLLSTVNFNAVGGAIYRISVGGYAGAQGYFNLILRPVSPMGLTVGSSAVGSIGFWVFQGPPNGTFFAAFTLNQGTSRTAGSLGSTSRPGSRPAARRRASRSGARWIRAATSRSALQRPAVRTIGVRSRVGFTTIGGAAPVLISAPDSGTVQ